MAQGQVHPQRVVPFEMVVVPEGKKPGWTPMFDEGGNPIGLMNPTFGLIRHSAIVNAGGGFLGGSVLHEDGPLD